MTLVPGIFCLTDDIPKKKLASIFRPHSPDVLAYLDFSVSTTGILAGVKVGPHGFLLASASWGREGTGRGKATDRKDACAAALRRCFLSKAQSNNTVS